MGASRTRRCELLFVFHGAPHARRRVALRSRIIQSALSQSQVQCRVFKNEESGQLENRCKKVFRKWRHCQGRRELVEEVVEETVQPPLHQSEGAAALLPSFPPGWRVLPAPRPQQDLNVEGLLGNFIAEKLLKDVFGVDGVQREGGAQCETTLRHPQGQQSLFWPFGPALSG